VKVGDLVISKKGNTGLILAIEELGIYFDVLWLKTGVVRTGLHRINLSEVISESR